MGYGRFMGYAMHFPAHQLGGHKMLWDKRGYGFTEVWVKRGSTVLTLADISLGSRVGSEPWYRYSASIETCADHSTQNSMVASTN